MLLRALRNRFTLPSSGACYGVFSLKLKSPYQLTSPLFVFWTNDLERSCRGSRARKIRHQINPDV